MTEMTVVSADDVAVAAADANGADAAKPADIAAAETDVDLQTLSTLRPVAGGLGVAWSGLSVTIHTPTGALVAAVRPCSFVAGAGRTLAVMGSTGSGKTTLLSALAHRGPYSTGTISFVAEGRSAREPWSKTMKREIGFITQDDVVWPELTVRQSLCFTARLRLGLNAAEAAARVAVVLEVLRMARVADNRIGSVAVRGLSGGERKRLCIGTELVTGPRLLFCDEPSSGLDSSMAVIVVKVLREVSRLGIGVVSSIHQPSSVLFALFDDVCFLEQGQLMYAGEAAKLGAYFGDLGHPTPHGHATTDWVMDLLVFDRLNANAKAAVAKDNACEAGAVDGAAGRGGALGGAAAYSAVSFEADLYSSSAWEQTKVLLQREWLMERPKLWQPQTLKMMCGIALIISIFWWRTGYAEADIFARLSYCFFIIMM